MIRYHNERIIRRMLLTNYIHSSEFRSIWRQKFGYYVADEKAVQLFDNAQVKHLLKEDARKVGEPSKDLETPFGQTIDKRLQYGYMDGTTRSVQKVEHFDLG